MEICDVATQTEIVESLDEGSAGGGCSEDAREESCPDDTKADDQVDAGEKLFNSED